MNEEQRDPGLVIGPAAQPNAAKLKALIEAVCGVYILRKAQSFFLTDVNFGTSRYLGQYELCLSNMILCDLKAPVNCA